MFVGRYIPFLKMKKKMYIRIYIKFKFLSLGEERDIHTCQVGILNSTYLVFKQQGHNSLSQVNPCNLSIRQALEADLKIFLDSDCLVTWLPTQHEILPGIQGYPHSRRYFQEYRVTHIAGDITRNTGLPTQQYLSSSV